MSKMDNLRAMREAKYARAQERGAGAGAPARRATQPAARPAAGAAAATPSPVLAEPPAVEASEELCGHRNMGGRTCTRERGHSAKSHRYS